MDVLENLRKKSSIDNKILFPEDDSRVYEAVEKIKANKTATPLIVNNTSRADINPIEHPKYEKFCEDFYNLRKHKGISREDAKEYVKNPITFSSLMVRAGMAYGMVVGASLSAKESLVPIFQVIKPSNGKASSHFLMTRGEESLVFSDCAVIENPDAGELEQIALETGKWSKKYGMEPRVAMLSYFTRKEDDKHKIGKVSEATKKLKERGDFPVEGEIQFDAAYVEEVARKKGAHLEIKGDANVFIFPDLASGNIGYKITERLGGFKAIGPILQGMPHPIAYLSRGCTSEDIYDVATVLSGADNR